MLHIGVFAPSAIFIALTLLVALGMRRQSAELVSNYYVLQHLEHRLDSTGDLAGWVELAESNTPQASLEAAWKRAYARDLEVRSFDWSSSAMRVATAGAVQRATTAVTRMDSVHARWPSIATPEEQGALLRTMKHEEAVARDTLFSAIAVVRDRQAAVFVSLRQMIRIAIALGLLACAIAAAFAAVLRRVMYQRSRIRDSEARFHQLADHLDQVLWLVPPDKSQQIYVNQAYEKIWGRSVESVNEHPRSSIDAVHPDDRDRVASALERQKRGEVGEETYRILRPDGTERWIRSRALPVRDADGATIRTAGVSEDITEHKKAADRLLEQHAFLNAVLENTRDCVVAMDLAGHVQWANGVAARVLGCSPAEIFGKTMAELAAEHGATNTHFLGTGEVDRSEHEVQIEGETRAFFTMRTPYRNGGGDVVGFVVVSHDLTEYKQAEAQARAVEIEHVTQLRVAAAQDEERARISRELHDDVGEALAGLQLSLRTKAQRGVSLEDEIAMAKDAIQTVLQLARILYPPDLELAPVGAIVTELLGSANAEFQVQVTSQGVEPALSPRQKGMLFRIVREAITESHQHHRARKVVVLFDWQAAQLALVIEDDGKRAGETSHSVAGRNMCDRAGILGGSIEWTAREAGGTRVQVRIPLRGSHSGLPSSC